MAVKMTSEATGAIVALYDFALYDIRNRRLHEGSELLSIAGLILISGNQE